MQIPLELSHDFTHISATYLLACAFSLSYLTFNMHIEMKIYMHS